MYIIRSVNRVISDHEKYLDRILNDALLAGLMTEAVSEEVALPLRPE